MAYAQSNQQRGYVQRESSFGIIPNSTGTATVGNNDAFRFISLATDAVRTTIDRPDKTGSLSRTVGSAGRRSGNWSTRFSLAGSGTAGTAPDVNDFLEALFGKAKTVVADTSVGYTLDTNIYSLSIFNYRTPSTVTQQIAHGGLVDRAVFTLGEDVAQCEMSGPCQWVLDDDEFSTADSTAKGGLTSFPSEPASPATLGDMAIGFTGSVVMDGDTYGTLRRVTITVTKEAQLDLDVYNNYYAPSGSFGTLAVNIEGSIYDDDSSDLSALKVKAKNGTPVDMVYTVGTVAGNIWAFTLKNVILEPFTYDDGARRYAANIRGRAHATSLTSKDEIALLLT
jgi:hypothetical protein